MGKQRILEIILIFVIVEQLEAKALNRETNLDRPSERVKRGYSKYGQNEYGPSIQVSSSVFQYGHAEESGTLDTGAHFEAPSINEDPWKSAGLSEGYEVWLEPSSSYHPSAAMPDIHSSSDIHTSSIASSHPGSDYIANSVFSDDSSHSAHFELPSSQLHTQISSSGASGSSHIIDDHHSLSTISDNVDFNNVADIKSKHYAKSYGK